MQSTQFAAHTHLALVYQVGMMLAQAVFHGDNIPLHLAQPLLKQVSIRNCCTITLPVL